MNSKNRSLIIAVIVVVVVVGGLVGYGLSYKKPMSSMSMGQDQSSGSSTSSADAKETNSVTIENFSYSPAVIKVKAGTKVTWTNQDGVQHNVVGDDLKELDGKLLSKGESFSYTFNKAGTYAYHCDPHPYMKGTVIVTE